MTSVTTMRLPRTELSKCAVAFRKGLMVGLFATAAIAAMLFWASNSGI